MGPLTRIARANRIAKHEAEIRKEAAKLPPRVEERRVPAIAPIPQPAPGQPGEMWRMIDLNERPKSRTMQVAVIPPPGSFVAVSLGASATEHCSRDALFHAVEHRLDFTQQGGGTRVRWWSWEHRGENPELKKRLNRAVGYANRVRECLTMVIGPPGAGPWALTAHGIDPYCPVPRRDLWAWVETVIEDCEQALGKP